MNHNSFRVLAEGVSVSNNTWETGLANNDLIIGPTGSGKTRSYVLPNLMDTQESFIVTDTKGSLCKQAGPLLEQRGFQVIELDFSDLFHSPWGYNPFRFIRWDEERGCHQEQDILTVSAAMVPVDDPRQPFWELIARNMMEALVAYTLECLPPEEHHMGSVIRLFEETGSPQVLDGLMMELSGLNPNSFAVSRWRRFQTCQKADKMYGSILGILSQKISGFGFSGAEKMFLNPRQLDFAEVSRRKTAVFVKVSDCDFSLASLTSLFYTQALQTLIAEADGRPDNRLKIPVRLYLDDFANLNVPDFDKTISVVRSREISVSVMLQSVTQLESGYGHAKAMTIIDNCDHLLYLGGQSLDTARFIGSKANKPEWGILNMPLGEAWLFERGSAPRAVRKYNLKKHPLYCQLPEYAAAHPVSSNTSDQAVTQKMLFSAGM